MRSVYIIPVTTRDTFYGRRQISFTKREALLSSISGTYPSARLLLSGEFSKKALHKNGELSNYLLEKDSGSRKIIYLPGGDHFNLLELSVACRHIIAKIEKEDFYSVELILVTSSFNRDRTERAFTFAFPECKSTIEVCDDNQSTLSRWRTRRSEKKRLIKDSREAKSLIRFGQGEFPTQIYQSADNDHKHYDRSTITLISGMFVLYGAPFWSLEKLEAAQAVNSGFAMCSVFVGFLFLLAVRAMNNASSARHTMRMLEIAHGLVGHSSLYFRRRTAGSGTTAAVFIVFVLMITTHFIYARLVYPGL